jgi:sulfur-carrier protein
MADCPLAAIWCACHRRDFLREFFPQTCYNRYSQAFGRKPKIMAVKVRIPSPLRSYTNGADIVESPGVNVGEVLNNLKSKASGIETRLFKGPNQLNRFVNIYVNDEDIRFLSNLDTPVKEGDEISIVPAIAGG